MRYLHKRPLCVTDPYGAMPTVFRCHFLLPDLHQPPILSDLFSPHSPFQRFMLVLLHYSQQLSALFRRLYLRPLQQFSLHPLQQYLRYSLQRCYLWLCRVQWLGLSQLLIVALHCCWRDLFALLLGGRRLYPVLVFLSLSVMRGQLHPICD